MSQETPIGNLGGGSMNQEDSRLVDSILNDLNSGGQQQQQQQQQQQMPMEGGHPQQMSQEEHRAMLEHRQQEMMHHQMMQQQMMQQQMQQKQNEEPSSLLDKLQSDWKGILIVVVLSVVVNTSVVDDLFKMGENTFFIQENGVLNMQAVIIKALAVGALYFVLNYFIKLH
tara:strand:+ start:181 stop:690 length:510 start_codon:yes stop_codon:yes gene_type:complete